MPLVQPAGPHRVAMLKRTAELAHQPLETIVEQSLAHSLPPLLEDIPAEYQAEAMRSVKANGGLSEGAGTVQQSVAHAGGGRKGSVRL